MFFWTALDGSVCLSITTWLFRGRLIKPRATSKVSASWTASGYSAVWTLPHLGVGDITFWQICHESMTSQNPQAWPKRPGIQFWKLHPPHTLRLLHLGLFNLRWDLRVSLLKDKRKTSKTCWAISLRWPIWFDKRIDDTDYIILHEYLWITYKDNHVSPLLRSRLAVLGLRNPPSFLWARTFQGKAAEICRDKIPSKI